MPPVVAPLASRNRMGCPMLERVMGRLVSGKIRNLFPLKAAKRFCTFSSSACEGVLRAIISRATKHIPICNKTDRVAAEKIVELMGVYRRIKISTISMLAPVFMSRARSRLCGCCGAVTRGAALPVVVCGGGPGAGIAVAPTAITGLTSVRGVITMGSDANSVAGTTRCVHLAEKGSFSMLVKESALVCTTLYCKTAKTVTSYTGMTPEVTTSVCSGCITKSLRKTLRTRFALTPFHVTYNVKAFPTTVGRNLIRRKVPMKGYLSPVNRLAPRRGRGLRGMLTSVGLIWGGGLLGGIGGLGFTTVVSIVKLRIGLQSSR